MSTAVLSSLHDRALLMLAELAGDPGGGLTFLGPLAQSVAARRNEPELAQSLKLILQSSHAVQAAVLEGLAAGRKNAPRQPLVDKGARDTMAVLAASADPGVRKATHSVEDTLVANVIDDEPLLASVKLPPVVTLSDETFRSYVAALSGTRDQRRGHELFLQACAACHRIGSEGQEVGPDLLGQLGMAEEALLKDILVPSERIRPGFETTLVQLGGGAVVTGILKDDGATSLRMVAADGVEQVLLRKDVTGVRRLAGSLMPSFAETLTPSDVGNLLAWLRGQMALKPGTAAPRPVR